MKNAILYLCGGINALFALFHVLLGVAIQRMPGLGAEQRALLHVFNVGGTLMIAFLAWALLGCPAGLRTQLGRAAILLGAAVYLTRAAGEYVFFPVVHPAIVVTCVAAGALHLSALWAVRPTATA